MEGVQWARKGAAKHPFFTMQKVIVSTFISDNEYQLW